MKILIIGGIQRSLVNFRGNLIQDLKSNGHSVYTCAKGEDQEITRKLIELGAEYHPIPIERAGINCIADLWTTIKLLRIILQIKPHIVLTYTIKPVIFGGIAAAVARVPHIYSMITGLGYAFSERTNYTHRLIFLFAKILYKISLKFSSKVFFQNPDDIQLFYDLHLIDPEKPVLLNGSGIDLTRFTPVPLPQTPVFLMVARLVADKGVREYVAAARLIRMKYPHAKFLLAGDLDANPKAITRDELKAWQEEKVIDYLGFVSDIRSAIGACNVFVLPSYYREGTPRTVLEAMAMGRPIITTDSPGCRETVRNNANGFLIPKKSVPELAMAMEYFITNQDSLQEMGYASLSIAQEKYDVIKVNKTILQAMNLI